MPQAERPNRSTPRPRRPALPRRRSTAPGEEVRLDEVRAALVGAGGDLTALVRSLEPDDRRRPVPGVGGTVGDIVSEVVTLLARDPCRTGGLDAAGIGSGPRLDPGEAGASLPRLADALEVELDALARLLEGTRDDARIELRPGQSAALPATVACLAFDLTVAGADIARAGRRPWPVPARRAAAMLQAVLPVLGPWVHPAARHGPRQHVDVVFDPAGPGVSVRVGAGEYDVRPGTAEGGVDAVDPVETLLAIAGRHRARDPRVARLAGWFTALS